MKYIITEDPERFIGLSKLEVLLNLDSRPKLCHSKEWVYIFRNYWFGQKMALFIEFDNDDRVITLYILSNIRKL
ncbi:MAG: hypothetical protein J0I88_09460 [Chryseobacterium sp.]|nr:hypothetical protein [Chryseobacterium sp.]OJX29696.1 MAG: hypothetical protein BGO86_12525 [Chryseobacterium sp. 36-9]